MYKNCNTRDRRFLITNLLEFGNKSIKIHKTWVRNRKHDILYCKRDYTCSPNIAYREKALSFSELAVQHKNSRKIQVLIELYCRLHRLQIHGVARLTSLHTDTHHVIERNETILTIPTPNTNFHVFAEYFRSPTEKFTFWANLRNEGIYLANEKIISTIITKYAFLDDKLETTI